MSSVTELHGAVKRGDLGTQGRWKQFSNASLEDWRKSAEIIRAHGGVE